MKIQRAEVFPTRLPFRKTFKISRGAVGSPQEGAPHVFVRLTADDGTEGWGEARPSHRWSYETEESVVSTLRNYLAPLCIGLDCFEIQRLHEQMERQIAPGTTIGQPIAKSALDMAFHDIACRASGVSLCEFLGSAPIPLRLAYIVSAENPEEAAEATRAGAKLGHTAFKIKLGLNPDLDPQIVAAVKEAAPGGFLWADANQAYTPSQAARLGRALASEGAAVLEQPLPANDWTGLRQLRSASALPIAVDESAFSPRDLIQLIKLEAADCVVVKVAKSGGLRPARLAIEIAREAGLEILGSGLTESGLGFAASAHLYAAYHVEVVDLNGPQFLADDPLRSRVRIEAGKAFPAQAPGFGIEMDLEKLSRFEVKS